MKKNDHKYEFAVPKEYIKKARSSLEYKITPYKGNEKLFMFVSEHVPLVLPYRTSLQA